MQITIASVGSEDAVRDALQRLLTSDLFRRSPGLSRLLVFLVEQERLGHTESLKELLIGRLFYLRPDSYDPKTDSVVRANATRLRQRLQTYYAEHPDEPVIIEIPPGSYVPRYIARSVNDTSASPPSHTLYMTSEKVELVQEVCHVTPVTLLPPGGGPQRRLWRRATPAAVMLAVGLLIFFTSRLHSLRNSGPKERSLPEAWIASHLSAMGGMEEFPALSPDGQQVAFVWRGSTDLHPHIYLQDVSSGRVRRLTDGDVEDSRPAWSPNGQEVAYLHRVAPDRKEVYIQSLASKASRKIVELRGQSPWLCGIPRLSWSPDGQTIFSSAVASPAAPCAVVAIDVVTGNLRQLTQPPVGYLGDMEAAVSPDGKQVAFLRNAGSFDGDLYIWKAPGLIQRITSDHRDIMGFTWSADGQSLITSSRRGNGLPRLWLIPLNQGEPRPLTDGVAAAAFPNSSRNGAIAFTVYRLTTSIWKWKDGKATRVIADTGGNSAPSISPDGKSLVYRSDRTGSFELWLDHLDGKGSTRLTNFNGPMVNSPVWSPDGQKILFECRPRGQSQLCTVSPQEAGHVNTVGDWPANQTFPSWSHDGKAIYFSSNSSGRWEIYRQQTGQTPIQITRDGGLRALEDPSGRWLYFSGSQLHDGVYRMAIQYGPAGTVSFGMTEKVSQAIHTDMDGDWQPAVDGIDYVLPEQKSIRIYRLTPEQQMPHLLAEQPGSAPPGDLILSSDARDRAFFYVQSDREDGEVDLLLTSGNQSHSGA